MLSVTRPVVIADGLADRGARDGELIEVSLRVLSDADVGPLSHALMDAMLIATVSAANDLTTFIL